MVKIEDFFVTVNIRSMIPEMCHNGFYNYTDEVTFESTRDTLDKMMESNEYHSLCDEVKEDMHKERTFDKFMDPILNIYVSPRIFKTVAGRLPKIFEYVPKS